MNIVDGRKLSNVSEIETEICIVGSGPAGMTLASELNGGPHEVCLVESGGYTPDEEVQALYDLDNIGYPIRQNFMSRARYYGGSSNLWPGRCMVLNEIDFEKRSWVPNSGWPIPYAELTRYYAKASEILRLPSMDKFDPIFWNAKVSKKEQSFFQNGSLRPNISMWAKKPLRFGSAYYSKLKRSRNITVYLHSNVTEIEAAENGSSINRLHLACLNGKRFSIRAKVYILACGGLENARLLLVSRKKHAAGLGNEYDQVGRYYMDHPRAVFGRVHLNEAYDLSKMLGLPISDGKMQMGIGLSEKIQKEEGLLNHYLSLEMSVSELTQKSYHSFVQIMKKVLRKGYAGKRFDLSDSKLDEIPDLIYLLAPREIIPHFVYRWYRVLRKKRKKTLTVINYCDQIPDPESRVRLIPEKDRLNMSRLELNWKVGDAEKRTLLRLQEILNEHLTANNMGVLDNQDPEIDEIRFSDASHHMGTTRMSENSKEGVVDKNGKVHGINNLFLGGSSVFPTAGHANPTFSIVALSLRLAEYLKGRNFNKSI